MLSFQAFANIIALCQHRSTCVEGWRPIWQKEGDELRIVGWPCEVEGW